MVSTIIFFLGGGHGPPLSDSPVKFGAIFVDVKETHVGRLDLLINVVFTGKFLINQEKKRYVVKNNSEKFNKSSIGCLSRYIVIRKSGLEPSS